MFKNKTSLFDLLVLIISTIFSYCSFGMIVGNTSISINQTISENLFKDKQASNTVLGMVYGHESFEETWEHCSTQPELSKTLRSLNTSEFVYDLYPSNFLETTPAVVNYIDEEKVPISFLLLPKGGYLDSFFSPNYMFHMLAGATDKTANIEDIYINQKYADYLLSISSEYSSYSDLLDEIIEVPYYTQYITKGVLVNYKIKGVIDSNDEKYIFFSKYIGDFFLANQYLSLPIKSCTIFDLENKMTSIKKQVNAITNTYNYKTNLKRFNSIENMYTYEYRLLSFDTLTTENNISSIENTESNHFSKYQKVYDYYFYKNNILKLLVFVAIFVCCFTVAIIYTIKAKKYFNSLKQKMILFGTIHLSCFIVSIFIYRLLFLLLLSSPYISPYVWLTFVIFLILSVSLFSISLITFKKNGGIQNE